jgi:hypothetical protein
LSKSLEAAMRLLCGDFLRVSIGPTIERIFSKRIALKPVQDVSRPIDLDDMKTMTVLIQSCWENMYSAQNAMPC